MRIAAGGISHETSTFALEPTTMREFESGFGLFRGEEIFKRFTGSNICMGGFIDGAREHGFELVPLLWTFAYPGGLIPAETYNTLKEELLTRLREADAEARLDGILLDLHGSMVVEGIEDGDGDLIAAVREVMGPDRPVIATFDLHSNHTPLRVQKANAVVGFDTYPHVDMNERGREAAALMFRTVRGEIHPVSAIRQIPLFWSTPAQVTAHPPMVDVINRLHEKEQQPGILSMTVATGFPWADVTHVGCSVMAVADGDEKLAQAAADEFAEWIWENRHRWYVPPLSVRDAVEQGQKIGKYPIILADHADNTGGGSPGDSTEVLRTLMELNLEDVLMLYIVDPEAIRLAHEAGQGSRIKLPVGGKSDPVQGPPIEMEVEVVALSEGDFTYDGPMYAGLTGNMGPSAWLRQGSTNVVVVTAREQPLGPAFARTLGIDVEGMKYIVVKSAAHFRAAFETLAGSIFNVDAAGIHTHLLGTLPYKSGRKDVFPWEISPEADMPLPK